MTETSDWTFASASVIAQAIRRRVISSVEILNHYIQRIDQLNPALNAVVAWDLENARLAAVQADEAVARGDKLGPLHGVPITVKEAFDVHGLPSTWGFSEYADNIATSDSLAVSRYRRSGAVVFAKTNVPTALADWQSFNPVYGTTCNPWDHSKTPGGSSGGSAAALAAGFTALETGSDIGASIRNPAHYCGVFGHKPSMGIASSRGHALPHWRNSGELDISVIGPMARSAYDLEIALDTIAGADEIDSIGWQLNLPRGQQNSLADFTVGIVYSDDEAEVDQAVQDQLRHLASFLRDTGVTVREQHRPDIDSADAHENYIALLRAATSSGPAQEDFHHMSRRAEETDPLAGDYQSRMLRGTTMSHRQWLFQNEMRHHMRRRWASYFEDTDLLLCPVATTVAFDHNQSGERWERMIPVNGSLQPTTTALFWAGYSGNVYLPSTVAPIGLTDDLPVGVQIVGPQYHDHRCIRFAQLLEDNYYRFQPPPAYQ